MITMCRCTSKSLLGLLSLLFAGAAVCLFTIGIYVFVTYKNFDEFIDSKYTLVPAAVVLAVGIIFFAASCIGCCSVIKEKRSLLCMFGTFLFLLVSLLIAATVCVYIYKTEIDGSVYNQTKRAVEDYKDREAVAKQVDYVQSTLMCCGANNYTDWAEVFKNSSYVPMSCCVNKNESHCNGHEPPGGWGTGFIYTEGCYEKIGHVFLSNLNYIAGASIVFELFLIIGFFATCILMCYRRDASAPYFSLSSH